MKPLKLIGKDRDADTLVWKTIAERGKIARAAFNGCVDLCQTSLKEAQVLHLKTNDFIYRDVEGVNRRRKH